MAWVQYTDGSVQEMSEADALQAVAQHPSLITMITDEQAAFAIQGGESYGGSPGTSTFETQMADPTLISPTVVLAGEPSGGTEPVTQLDAWMIAEIEAGRRDDPRLAGLDTNGAQPASALSAPTMVPGADLRDPVLGPAALPTPPLPFGAVPTALLPLALQVLRVLLGRATVITARAWGQLPGWARAALAGAGFGIGVDIALNRDIPLITLPFQGGDGGAMQLADRPFGPELPAGQHIDIPGVHLGAHVIGSWVANGVTFYRLSDGKLAVQNLKGRWKVWRPKKPIVLYATGAVDLKTLLRADAVLNRQAKRIARLLNRRAPTRAKKPTEPKTVIIESHGRAVN